jgi:hypothetical protein
VSTIVACRLNELVMCDFSALSEALLTTATCTMTLRQLERQQSLANESPRYDSPGRTILLLSIIGLLSKRGDLVHDFGLDPRTLVDTDVRNGRIVRQIDIYDFAVETVIPSDGLAPPGGLVIVDRLHDVGGDRILQKRRERHQEIDCDIV